MSDAEERRFPRFDSKLRVEVRSELEPAIHGTILDLSTAGIFVVSESRLPVGTTCELAIEGADPDGPESIGAIGRVAHVQMDGMGIEITEIDLEDHEELRRLAAAWEASH